MSTSKVSVSVIVPTYNRAQLLGRALASVLSQDYGEFELVVVDDGSTDGTRALVEDLSAKDHRVRCLHTQNSGVSSARNLGISSSSGELIAFLDSDDEWLPGKLQKQVRLYVEQPYVLCHSDEIWIRNGRRVNQMKKHQKSGGDIFLKCLPLCCISPSATVIKRSLLDEVGLFDEDFQVCEDYDLWLRITSRHEVAYIDEPLIRKYGGHSDQLSNRSWGNDVYRVRALQKIIASGMISGQKLEAAIDMLKTKCRILADGFQKHGSSERASYYRCLSEDRY